MLHGAGPWVQAADLWPVGNTPTTGFREETYTAQCSSPPVVTVVPGVAPAKVLHSTVMC